MFSWILALAPTSLFSLATASLGFLTPVLSALTKFLSWYLAEMYDGLKTIFSNFSTLIVIGTIIGVTLLYGTQAANCDTLPSVVTDTPAPWSHDFGIR